MKALPQRVRVRVDFLFGRAKHVSRERAKPRKAARSRAKPRGTPRFPVLVKLASLAQIGELAESLLAGYKGVPLQISGL